jgi:hypothetical protein
VGQNSIPTVLLEHGSGPAHRKVFADADGIAGVAGVGIDIHSAVV